MLTEGSHFICLFVPFFLFLFGMLRPQLEGEGSYVKKQMVVGYAQVVY